MSALRISAEMIRDVARERLQDNNLAKVVVQQAWYEHWVLFKKRVNFRKRRNDEAREAYCAMEIGEFEAINARQRWSNWRTIPRNLNGVIPNRPVFAIDLCCGVGDSTEVLASYLPVGSRILGLEYNPDFVKKASARVFRGRDGKKARVAFRAQSVLETFYNERGLPIRNGSVDLLNSSGAVGCHFDPQATEALAAEAARVLRRGGVAMIDSGIPGTHYWDLKRIFTQQGFEPLGSAKSCIFDLYRQVRFRKT